MALSFTNSFNKYLLSTYCVPGIGLRARVSWPWGFSVQWTREKVTVMKCNSGMLSGGRAAPPPGGAPPPVLEHPGCFPGSNDGSENWGGYRLSRQRDLDGRILKSTAGREKLGVFRRRGGSREAETEMWGEGRLQRCEGCTSRGCTSRRSRQALTGHPVPQITGVTVAHPLWASSTRTASWDPRGSSGGVLMRKQVHHPGSHEA